MGWFPLTFNTLQITFDNVDMCSLMEGNQTWGIQEGVCERILFSSSFVVGVFSVISLMELRQLQGLGDRGSQDWLIASFMWYWQLSSPEGRNQ